MILFKQNKGSKVVQNNQYAMPEPKSMLTLKQHIGGNVYLYSSLTTIYMMPGTSPSMRNRQFFCIAILVLAASRLFAQADSGSGLVLLRDARVDALVKKQAQINKVAVHKSSNGQYKGFRLMILNTNNRDEAYQVKSDLLRRYSDQNVYMAYQAPYYKIKMGDFLKKVDAEKFKKQITGLKQSVFVVQDIIKVKPEDEARLLKDEAEQ